MEPKNPYQSLQQQKPYEQQPDTHKEEAVSQTNLYQSRSDPQVSNQYVQSPPKSNVINPYILQEAADEQDTNPSNVLHTPLQMTTVAKPAQIETFSLAKPMDTQLLPKKPKTITLIMILDGISGFTSIFLGLALFLGGITFLLGVYTWVVAALAIVHVIRLSSTHPNVVTPNKALAILQILSLITGNVLSFVIGIINLMIYSHPDTKAFYRQMSKQQLWKEDSKSR